MIYKEYVSPGKLCDIVCKLNDSGYTVIKSRLLNNTDEKIYQLFYRQRCAIY